MKARSDYTDNSVDCLHNDSEKQGNKRIRNILGPREKNTDCYRGKRKGGIRMPYNSKALGLIISSERVRKGMTQEQLSGSAGISRSHLAALESGQKSPRVDTLWRIAEALSLKPSKMFISLEKTLERKKEHEND